MVEHVYLAIDGTDNLDNSSDPNLCMAPDGIHGIKSSHVRRMMYRGFARTKYFPGTTDSISGRSSYTIIDNAMGWIKQAYGSEKTSGRKLYLGGFSRGAAGIIVLAHRLAAMGIPVQEMYIFDAVDRSFWMENDQTATIPKNVVRAYHAVRDPKAGSRRSFGNCGMQSAHGNLEIARFNTTHGGVGGWPNGKKKVTPGFGPEDWAYVGAYGAMVAPAVVAMDPNQDKIHEFGEAWPSNVTPAAEIDGMKKAMAWMYSKAFTSLAAGG